MLALTHFDDRHITGKHHTFESRLLPRKRENLSFYFFRTFPVSTDYICPETLILKSLLVGMEFF